MKRLLLAALAVAVLACGYLFRDTFLGTANVIRLHAHSEITMLRDPAARTESKVRVELHGSDILL